VLRYTAILGVHLVLSLLPLQVIASEAQAAQDVPGMCTAYKQLAHYFAQLGRLHTSLVFYTKCLDLSQATGWREGEMEACLALGIVYEELRDVAAAIACHERRLELALEQGTQVGILLIH
jgi:tetratricopeptide (TPR) repeat protein